MPNTVDYYLSKGFDRPMAEYFANGRKRLAAVAPQPDFTLLLTYEDGEKRVYDMKPFLEKGGVFVPFRDYSALWLGILTQMLTAMLFGATRWIFVQTGAMWTVCRCLSIRR